MFLKKIIEIYEQFTVYFLFAWIIFSFILAAYFDYFSEYIWAIILVIFAYTWPVWILLISLIFFLLGSFLLDKIKD